MDRREEKTGVGELTDLVLHDSSRHVGFRDARGIQDPSQVRDDHPQRIADLVYEAICKDIEVKPTAKGAQLFRDRVFEHCSPQAIVLKNVR